MKQRLLMLLGAVGIAAPILVVSTFASRDAPTRDTATATSGTIASGSGAPTAMTTATTVTDTTATTAATATTTGTATAISPPTPATTTTGPCGRLASPAPVEHIIWILMENHGYDQVVRSSSAPFENTLIKECGLASNFHADAHPSLPNYIALTSGSTQGVTDDGSPAAHPLAVPSIFSQVRAAGLEWRSYQESAPSNCPLTSGGRYAVRHDPAQYYTGIRDDCVRWDVPMGTTSAGNLRSDLDANGLPALSFFTPNLCSDTHDCSVATGDAWLRAWFSELLASPGYVNGSTLIFLTWDEDEGAESNRIPTIVVSPSTRPGTVSSASFSHASMLRTTEQLLGITQFLGHAADPSTNSMRASFNL